MRYRNSFVSNRQPPLDDIRCQDDRSTPWNKFKAQHYDTLSCYQTIVKDVLSAGHTTSLTLLQKVLRVQFGYPVHLIQKTIGFLSTFCTVDVEWIERDNVREPLIRLRKDKNLSHIKPTGSYSVVNYHSNDK